MGEKQWYDYAISWLWVIAATTLVAAPLLSWLLGLPNEVAVGILYGTVALFTASALGSLLRYWLRR